MIAFVLACLYVFVGLETSWEFAGYYLKPALKSTGQGGTKRQATPDEVGGRFKNQGNYAARFRQPQDK